MKKILIPDDYMVWYGRVAACLSKPIDLKKVKVLIGRALEAQELTQEVRSLRSKIVNLS